jgi:hypothetical protein
VTFKLTGAPKGMAVSTTGVISWAIPVAGNYAVTVSAKDSKTGLSGSAACSVTITSGGPVIKASALSGVAGKPLTGTISFSDVSSKKVSIAISSVPAGITITPNGSSLALRWRSPVVGSYALSVTAKGGDGLTTSLTVPITIKAK